MLSIAPCWFQNRNQPTKQKIQYFETVVFLFLIFTSKHLGKNIGLGEDDGEGVHPFHSEHLKILIIADTIPKITFDRKQ